MSLLDMGIAAARSGNRAEARMFLEGATLEDPGNEQAFLWLSFVLDEPKLAMRCLERVLEINPRNEQAKRGLNWLRTQQSDKGASLPQRLSDAEFAMMLQALKHSDEQVISGAIRRLAESSDSRAVEPLVNLLATSKSKLVQSQARAALISIGTPSVEPVMERLMKEKDPALASQLAAVLARVRSMAALAACREVIEGAVQPLARYSMAINLTASTHGEAAIGIVHDYLADKRQDERARSSVTMAIGQSIKTRALEANLGLKTLLEIRSDRAMPPALQQAALIAMGVSSHASAVKPILEAVRDQDVRMRVAAVDALAHFTPPQMALLDKLARSPDQAVRTRANQVLDKIQAAQKR